MATPTNPYAALDGQYELHETVGTGGFAKVKMATHLDTGEKVAVICDEAIPRDEQRAAVMDRLRASGHEVVSISYDQLDAFAGNMLELRTKDGERLIAMSQQAYDSLKPSQLAVLKANGRIASSPITTIEMSAGGSVRCMLAEIHLPHN